MGTGRPKGIVWKTRDSTRTLQVGPGILWVQVRVTLKIPEGYLCHSLGKHRIPQCSELSMVPTTARCCKLYIVSAIIYENSYRSLIAKLIPLVSFNSCYFFKSRLIHATQSNGPLSQVNVLVACITNICLRDLFIEEVN